MSTSRDTLRLDAANGDDVRRAARLLRAGGLVAFPTETVYGLGANALDPAAVEKIFAAKQRPAWDPLIVHLASVEEAELERVARVPVELRDRVACLSRAFWPGPLTLLLPRAAAVSDVVTAGRPLVGVRVPSHTAAQALLQAAGVPLAAPSANRFGHTSPTSAQHVLDDLDGRIDAVLDGGACQVGVESTVYDPAANVVYRPGGVPIEALERALGERVSLYVPGGTVLTQPPESLPSPGVGIRHYAPAVRLRLTAGTPGAVVGAVTEEQIQARRVGVMLPKGWQQPKHTTVWQWGEWEDAEALNRGVFAGLRSLEQAGVDVIVCPLPEAGETHHALRDRLEKAARPE